MIDELIHFYRIWLKTSYIILLTIFEASRSISYRKMELDEYEKNAVRELSESVNTAIEKSARVADAIRYLRELGYEPNLTLKLEISLQEIDEGFDGFTQDIELELTDEDLRTLRRMKIRLDSQQWTVISYQLTGNKLITDNW